MTRKNPVHLDKKQWFLAVLEGDIEPNTAQIAKAVGVVSRTVLTWRQRAEQGGCPTGIHDGNSGWVFPSDHLADLFGFVSSQIKPYTYRWMKETINQWKQQQQKN
jgi:hypothetical protein